MAPRKRTVQAKSPNEEAMDTFGVELDSGDDEAPEEVTFEDSRAEALRSAKRALESSRREKDLLKEKRKRRQELFQEQKKRKMLSVKVLEEIDSSQKSLSEDGQDAPVTSQDEEQHEDKKPQNKKTKHRKLACSRNLKGSYKVMKVKPKELVSFQQKVAQDFIQSQLYGPGSRRTTSSQLLSLDNKRAVNKSAAAQFVKKEWAQKEKSKAEKLKMRWLQKHIPSS